MKKSLRILFTKRRDGSIVTRLERPDGTATWQRKDGAKAWFFAVHDLTHYAVETTLGHRRGFYGLVAEGWDLADFGTPWPRGPLPADAEPSELIAGFLDQERGAMEQWPAADFNARMADYYSSHQLKNPPVLDDPTLGRIRETAGDLRKRFSQLPPGETMELLFECD